MQREMTEHLLPTGVGKCPERGEIGDLDGWLDHASTVLCAQVPVHWRDLGSCYGG